MLGDWYVVEYYASAEEALSYSCMRAVFTQDDHIPAAGILLNTFHDVFAHIVLLGALYHSIFTRH